MTTEQEARSLIGSLMDFSFTSFVTVKIVKFIYGLGLVLGALGALMAIVTAFTAGGALAGIGTLLIVAPLGFLLFAMYLRVGLEVLVVIFRIAENTALMARQGGER